MRETALPTRVPAAVSRGQRIPGSLRQSFGAHPRRISDDAIEPAGGKDVGEVRVEREEWGTSVARQTPQGGAELAPDCPKAAQLLAPEAREPGDSAEEVPGPSC